MPLNTPARCCAYLLSRSYGMNSLSSLGKERVSRLVHGAACAPQHSCEWGRSRRAAVAERCRGRECGSAAYTGPVSKDRVVIGIDPDNHGAVAVVRLDKANGSVLAEQDGLSLKIYDMPLEKVQVAKRVRNQVDTAEAVKIIREICQETSDSEVMAYLEEPIPNPMNGLLSVLGTGFSFGVWKGVLAAHSLALTTCSARRWKGDMGLNKAGKEGSRRLAMELFPQAADALKRKKDHGRAEALLIVAWALGIRLPKDVTDRVVAVDAVGAAAEEPLDVKQVSQVIAEENRELDEDLGSKASQEVSSVT